MLRLVVLGASGQTGRRVVAGALARGWTVRAVARHATDVLKPAPGLEVQDLDLLGADTDQVRDALDGQDAIISTLGVGSDRGATTLYSTAAAAVLRARPGARVAVVSAVPVGGVEGHALPERKLAIPLLRRVFGGTYDDMARMERHLAASAAQWTVLRPPRLRNADRSGGLIRSPRPIRGRRSITTGDLAQALLDAVDGPTPTGQILYVATGSASARGDGSLSAPPRTERPPRRR